MRSAFALGPGNPGSILSLCVTTLSTLSDLDWDNKLGKPTHRVPPLCVKAWTS